MGTKGGRHSGEKDYGFAVRLWASPLSLGLSFLFCKGGIISRQPPRFLPACPVPLSP